MDTHTENALNRPDVTKGFSKEFWLQWLRRPALDVAESVIRLRRLRGLSQTQLAERMNTKQPAIARIESGEANVKIGTLAELAEALDTAVRVDLIPCEFLGSLNAPRWWEVSDVLAAVQGTPFAASTGFTIYATHEGLTPAEPAEAFEVSHRSEVLLARSKANSNLAMSA
jgi:transcriptional regulator with XRE-family HTH domain